jgi:hypothetical protein
VAGTAWFVKTSDGKYGELNFDNTGHCYLSSKNRYIKEYLKYRSKYLGKEDYLTWIQDRDVLHLAYVSVYKSDDYGATLKGVISGSATVVLNGTDKQPSPVAIGSLFERRKEATWVAIKWKPLEGSNSK